MEMLDLRKQIVMDLKKSKGIEGQTSKVILVLDVSLSIRHLFENGSVQELVERVLPVGMGFDTDQQVDVYFFDDYCKRITEVVTKSNLKGWVNRQMNKINWGGTNYSPVIKQIIKDFGDPTSGKKVTPVTVDVPQTTPEPKQSFFSKLFGGKKSESEQSKTRTENHISFHVGNGLKEPVYVIFITDGNNYDKTESKEAMIEASYHGIFFQFIGIGSADFPFLETLDTMSGRLVDNANFFKSNDLKQMNDEQLYNKLMGEYPQWLQQAKHLKLIP